MAEEQRKEKDTRKRTLFQWLDTTVHHVMLSGSFNEWQGCAMYRTKDCFMVTVPLDPGTYQYKFVVDGEWKVREDEEIVIDGDGNENNIIEVSKNIMKGKGKGKEQEQEQPTTQKKNVKVSKEPSKPSEKNFFSGGGKAKTPPTTTGPPPASKTPKTKKQQPPVPEPVTDDSFLHPETERKKQIVDPWIVEAGDEGVDYLQLVKDFGTKLIDDAILQRLQKVTGHPPHPWLKRGLFFSHRSLGHILDAVEKGEPFYLYTGRGPSSEALHLGHMMPFVFTKWLQDVFDVPLVVQLTDDEKFLWKDLSLEESRRLAVENAKDIIACGFDIKKTFIFRDTDYISHMYCNILKIQKCVTANQVKAIFGFDLSANIGKYMYPAIQAAPSFSSSFPHIFGDNSNYQCLIPCAIDQDPFFRMTRDVAPRIHCHKPAVIHAKFFPALTGPKTKMSASNETTAIFMTDTPEQISEKVRLHAFSGGRATKEEHQALGGDLEVDVPYQYLRVFDFDDDHLKRVGDAFKSGKMLSGEIKNELVAVLKPLVLQHQEARKMVTDDVVFDYMKIRPLDFRGSKNRV